MKNRVAFGALTFAFTIAGACIGHMPADVAFTVGAVVIVAIIGGFAAVASGLEL